MSSSASPTSAPLVHVALGETPGLAVVTLDRPQALNALSRRLRDELADTFDRLAADPRVRVLILTGRGRAFCAGLDVKELAQQGLAGVGEVRDPVAALARFPGPVIAAVNGPAITGGFELALACDVLLASTQAQFADTHARIGVMPGWGLSQRLPRMVGPSRAKALSLSGRVLSALQAERWGLVNEVLAPEELLPAAQRLAADMLAMQPALLQAYKRLIDDGLALPLGEALALEAERCREANARLQPQDIAAVQPGLFAQGRQAQRQPAPSPAPKTR